MNANGPAPDLGFKRRLVVVTGCASGTGRATARALLDQGAGVQGFDVASTDLPLSAFTLLGLREATAIEAAAGSVAGLVDALFKCAGIPPGRPPLDVMTVDFIGTHRLTEQLAPQMRPGSAIVRVSSNGAAGWCGQLPQLRTLVAA